MTDEAIKTAAEAAAPTATTDQAGLTINDLTLTLQVIQVATSRGAFKADELTPIGGLYDRLFKFLEGAGAISTTPETPESPVTEVSENEARTTKAQ